MDRPKRQGVRAMLTNALRKDASGELERMSLRSSRGVAAVSLWTSLSLRRERRETSCHPLRPQNRWGVFATIHRALELGIN